jgi:polysaccharide export outer membrane protein
MKINEMHIAVLLCMILNGCAIVPGQHMSVDALTHGNAPESGHIRLVQITPETLIADRNMPSQGTIARALLDYKPMPYHIGAGDSLYITVWDHPELTSPAGPQQQTLANGRLVRPDGTLFYPYVGTIKAAGMDIEQLRQVISRKLAKYIDNPQVDVSVIGYGSQRIMLEGAFIKTDPQSVSAVPMTLAQVIGSAGVDTAQANLSNLVLTRDGHDYHINLTSSSAGIRSAGDIYMKPGDQLFMPYNDDQEVYVMGEVVRPQAISLRTSTLTLTQVIGRAGGLNPVTSDGKAVYVIRGVANISNKPATVFHLNAHSPAAFSLADNFEMHSGDVVFVGPSGVTEWNRVLAQLLPLSGIANSAAVSKQAGF